MRAGILSRIVALACFITLTPFVQGQTWTALTNHPPSAVSACMLLTDGGVMCQSDVAWHKLTPDLIGSYTNGTWSTLASMPAGYGPTYYGSAVMVDGRVVVVGGEYNFGNFALSNMGAVYDPQTDSWQMLSPPSTGNPNRFQCMGDISTVVLSNGKFLVGSKLFQDLALLDPSTLSWAIVAATGKNEPSNAEEGWTLLADGSVFTLDVANAPAAERLLLSGSSIGAWVSAGSTFQDLHAPPGDTDGPIQVPGCPNYDPPGEMGPALLRPDGTVFAIGANGLTGIYTPPSPGAISPGSWVEGPALPAGLNVQDGPAALLPSGHVLFGGSSGEFGVGLQYFEFDGTSLISVSAPLITSEDDTSSTQLLVLPTGQVLFVDGTLRVQIYTPATSPTYNPAWAPVITSVPATLNNATTYQIMGTQFNGLSQGTAYGDEEQNATNYPLVQITNSGTGHVFYVRTHDHRTMGVATGNAPVYTNFDVPIDIEAGASTIQVVANGIPSAPVPITVLTQILPLTILTTSLPDGMASVVYSATLVATNGAAPYSWQLTSGTLPSGLTFNTQTGLLSGTTASLVTNASLQFKVTDSSTPVAQSASVTLHLTIAPTLTITTTSLPNGLLNVPYAGGLSATGGISPYRWQLSSGTLPSGLTLNPQTGQLSGIPTNTVTSSQLTFLVTDSGVPTPQTASISLSLGVTVASLTTSTTSLPNGEVNIPYMGAISASGGITPYNWQLISGTLPSGLILNPQTGQLSGATPAAVTNIPLAFKITDSSVPSQSVSITLSLTIATVLTITTTSLPNGQVNASYSGAFSARGGIAPYSWELTSGTLPTGLTLNSQTGQLIGTPSVAIATAQLLFTATDSSVPAVQTASVSLSITVIPSPLIILTASLPGGEVDMPYSVVLLASGGTAPYTWQLTSGTLPAGLTLNPQTGQLTGSPTTGSGNAPLTFKVTDSGRPMAQTASVNLGITVAASALTITTTSLPTGQINVPYSAALTAVGGILPYTWSSRRFPAGLTLNPQTGQITGTPTDLANTLLGFTVTDSSTPTAQTALTLSFTVTSSPLTITTVSLPNGQMGVPYSAVVSTVGGATPYTWHLISGTLPSGVTLNSQTGQLGGTPASVVANAPLTFKVTDSSAPVAQAAIISLTLTVTAAPPSVLTITTPSLATGQVGVVYSAALSAVGGTIPYTWQLISGTLPGGLTFNSQTGQIAGTPTGAVLNAPLTFKVTDSSAGTTQTATISLNVTLISSGPTTLTITTTSLPDGQVNVPYSAVLTAVGGVMPYTWSTRRLPGGLVLNPQTGQLTGTSSESTTDRLLVLTVVDSSTPIAQAASVILSLTINP